MFLTGDVAQEPTLEWTDAQKKADDEEYKRQRDKQDAPPAKPAKYSPRTQFVRLALEPEETSFFARSIVNRTWLRLFGLGIVDPPDQLHDDNPGSHPQLLEWLARDLRAHDYDLQRLIRGLVLSDAYARSSRWEGEEAPDVTYFAVGSMRALTPRQYGVSLFVAAWNPDTLDPSQDEEWLKQRERFENSANFMTDLIAAPDEHFQVGVEEVLYFSNNKRFQDEFVRDASDRLVGHLKTFDDLDKQIETAFRATLSRLPDEEERKLFREYLRNRQDRSLPGLQQAVWALLTSSELRFNY